MNIGIDFDNTIVKYDNLFKEVAITEGFIKKNWNGNGKNVLRDHLRKQPDGETKWMKLQGLVYGKYMHGAEIMPGVANFFLSCKLRNHRVFIVSHKTEYGHFDPEKISLRNEALKWMEVRRFFDPEYFGLDRKDVFFSETREEKVNIINRLNCGWFIDDLPEVFEEKHFPDSIQKILFGSYKPDQFQNRIIFNSWRKISEKILGQITDKDIVFWAKDIVDGSMELVEKIPGRGNSTVYKIDVVEGKSYVIKYYPYQFMDNRPRLETEFKALEMFYEHGIKNVPKPIKKNYNLNIGLYQWINGNNISKPSAVDLDQAISFIEKLFYLSKQIDGKYISIASEACFSAHDLASQIEKRLLRLNRVDKHFQELSLFLKEVFDPLWKKVKNESISFWPEESRENKLLRGKQTLSPSDFGFHNCLRSDKGILNFIDFDYFGWDDPVKLTADFIWHPAMNLDSELKENWKAAMLNLFSNDPQFESRLNAAMPLYGLRWALIILNEFLPMFAEQRKEAGETETYNINKTRKIQLNKARHYCEKVKYMVPQIEFS